MLKTVSAALFLLAGVSAAAAQAPAPAPEAPAAAEAPALPVSTDCTFTKAFLCAKDKDCAPSKTLGEINLPAHFLVHFGERVLVSVDASGMPHLSTVHTVSGTNEAVTLQGTDGGVGWIMQFSTKDNDVSLTTVSDDTVLTAFGSCKASH